MNIETKTVFTKWALYLLGLLGISFGYAFVSNDFSSSYGWLSFLALFVLLSLLTFGVWKFLLREQAPKKLSILLVIAIVIRLALGLVWYMALPEYGYDNELNEAGYVMVDAHLRDTAAWEFSQTEVPLLNAFNDYSYTDQYGGLLFLSAFVYRYVGAGVHQPLLMAVFSSFISSLAVLFVWGIAKREFGEKVAILSAGLLAFYPEAGLLGSSQMREAYLITLMVMMVFIFMRYMQNKSRKDLAALLIGLALSFSLSIPFVISVLIIIGILIIWNLDWSWLKKGKQWLKIISLFLVLLVVLVVFVKGIDRIYGVDYQEYLSLQASGKITSLFERIPEWTHRPFLVTYGVVRPLLPAALASLGNIVWSSIAIWRSVGWTVMLTLLLYATFMVFKEKVLFKLPGALMLYVWFGVLIASYRGAGDLWDNPRYRVIFAGLHVVLVSWALIKQRETKSPWLRRGIGFVAAMTIWFMVWFINRNVYYFKFPTGNLFAVVGLGLASGVIYLIWDWLKTQNK